MIAYLDCVGGLAGDMLLAALLDAGAPEAALRDVPARLGLGDVELRLERVQRHGIGALAGRGIGCTSAAWFIGPFQVCSEQRRQASGYARTRCLR